MQNNFNDYKEKYISKANILIKRYGYLNIIYLRVSTKKQEELDQLGDILKTFNLEKKKCLIIRANESAFQVKKQKNRKFNVIIDLIKELDINIDKKCYFWSIDRIYRNRELLEDFYDLGKKTNTRIYAHIEYFINLIADIDLPDDFSFLKDSMVKQLVTFLGWTAEQESKKKGQRLLKSLHKKDNGRTFTNKGNLYGNKLKTIKGKNIKDVDKVLNIEKAVAKRIKNKVSYRDIQKLLIEKLGIKISMGQLTNIKNKYL